MSNMPNKMTLDFWTKNKYNVLFRGKRGIGKSSVIIDLFNEKYGRKDVDWLYYSASTLDPWVDFVGVPRVIKDNDIDVIELVKPKALARDTVKAIFIDEFNRAPKKVTNAIMELIQFKSINGKRYENLEVIWAAINPPDDEETYHVEKMDLAVEDRFHIHVDLDYKLDKVYFEAKYGAMANGAIEWWNALTPELKDLVSPRRLDYALDIFSKNGNLKYVLDSKTNIEKLISAMASGPVLNKMNALMKDREPQPIIDFFDTENNFVAAVNIFKTNRVLLKFFAPFLKKEQVSLLLTTKGTNKEVLSLGANYQVIKEAAYEIVNANVADKLIIAEIAASGIFGKNVIIGKEGGIYNDFDKYLDSFSPSNIGDNHPQRMKLVMAIKGRFDIRDNATEDNAVRIMNICEWIFASSNKRADELLPGSNNQTHVFKKLVKKCIVILKGKNAINRISNLNILASPQFQRVMNECI